MSLELYGLVVLVLGMVIAIVYVVLAAPLETRKGNDGGIGE